jgi:hypothetical protein
MVGSTYPAALLTKHQNRTAQIIIKNAMKVGRTRAVQTNFYNSGSLSKNEDVIDKTEELD